MKESKCEKRALILTNHLVESPGWVKKLSERADMVIAADGGLGPARLASLRPDALVGDMDSIAPEELAEFSAAGGEALVYPVKKDKTDTHLAVEMALRQGCTHITIASSPSGRLDHILGNIMLLVLIAEAGANGRVESERTSASILGDGGQLRIERSIGDTVSLISLSSRVDGINLTGFEYPLQDALLRQGETLGISNVITGELAVIQMRKGRLLVIQTRRDEKNDT